MTITAASPSRKAELRYKATNGLWPAEAAGFHSTAIRRSTGALVTVYDAVEAGIEEYGFATVCEDHGRLVIHDTLTLAIHHASCPEGFCGLCNGTEEVEA